MDWRLILMLSLVGPGLALLSAGFLRGRFETAINLAMIGISALIVATRAPRRTFLHGFLAGLPAVL